MNHFNIWDPRVPKGTLGTLSSFLGTFRYLGFIWYLVDDESTCMSEGMTVTFQSGDFVLVYIL